MSRCNLRISLAVKFAHGVNMKVLRDAMHAGKRVIPYLGLIQKDVTFALEIESVLGKENEDLRYNMGKIEQICKIVAPALAWQKQWQKKNGWHEYRHQTDIIDAILNQKPITPAWADAMSDTLKAAEAKLS